MGRPAAREPGWRRAPAHLHGDRFRARDRASAPVCRLGNGHHDLRRVEGVLDHAARAAPPGRTARIAATLRRLHEGPPFPPAPSLAVTLEQFDVALRQRGESLSPALRRALDNSITSSVGFGARAPCHRDLNPGNILETADAVVLVDWETAGEGDPFVDLAQLGVFGFATVEARAELLHAYLEREPTADERAHAALARVTALGFYAVGFRVVATLAGIPAPVVATSRPYRDVLTDLGTARKDKALAQEAIAACQDALVIFRDRKMDDLTAGSEKNLAEAQALLAELH